MGGYPETATSFIVTLTVCIPQKLSALTQVVEIVMAFNPVSRKPLYRPHLIRRLPSVMVIDGKEVFPEERERVELFFSQEHTHTHPNVYTTDKSVCMGALLCCCD